MAVDTENKRRSTLRVLPVPDGEIDQADRQQVWVYSGIPVPGVVDVALCPGSVEVTAVGFGSVQVSMVGVGAVLVSYVGAGSVQAEYVGVGSVSVDYVGVGSVEVGKC